MSIPNLFSCVFRKINTRQMTYRRFEEGRVNEEISPQVEQDEQDLQGVQAVQVPK